MIQGCCKHTSTATRCIRRKDNKLFSLPRRHTKTYCLKHKQKGFSQKVSCAPYMNCKQFLFNPNDPKKSFDVYINKNPNDTISIKYKTIDDVKHTIRKLERLYKQGKHDHKRIKQVAMVMMVRLRVLRNLKQEEYNLSKSYHDFLSTRTITKRENRKSLTFFKKP
tara:strand:+ start:312 stop:806 length:495 start_codon:yes stop_codon:yes gene_type:complete